MQHCGNKKLLGAPGLTTRSKDTTRGSGLTIRNKKATMVFSFLLSCDRINAVGPTDGRGMFLRRTLGHLGDLDCTEERRENRFAWKKP